MEKEKRNRLQLTIRDITIIALMVAIIEVCKISMSFLPNIELTTFWLILFTLFLGRKVAFLVPVLILIEGSMFGFGLWWVMYLYAWPLLVFISYLFRKQESVWFWSIFSGFFGLFFGALCSIPYFFIGVAGGGILNGLYAAFTWWVAGIPFDLIHGIANFVYRYDSVQTGQ
ncbi:MAG: hypothetical protein IJ335_11105 [Lachnospiraceae bacterium]|nr:hypothetical protein [Lachnospiraceae bacterium]